MVKQALLNALPNIQKNIFNAMNNRVFTPRIIRAVLSGTFKRDLDGLARAYSELNALGCQILSPHRIDFVSEEKGFVKTAAEKECTFEELQQHHVRAISEADFVWLHAPEGHVGTSAAFEIGYAAAKGVPVFSRNSPVDPAIERYVKLRRSLFDALYELR